MPHIKVGKYKVAKYNVAELIKKGVKKANPSYMFFRMFDINNYAGNITARDLKNDNLE